MDLNGLGRRMYKLSSNIELNTNDLVKKVAIRVHHELVMETPVDTGQARSNWQVTIGQPATGVVDTFVPGGFGSTRGQNAMESTIAGLNVLDAKKPGQDVWITNNLPYISKLNDGYSWQAKPGYILVAILVGAKIVKTAKVTVTR